MTHYHFIGIGGTGLSAIARVLLESGHQVSGSDLKESNLSQAVAQAGGQVFIGHRAAQVSGADVVIRSSAIPDDNVEVQEAGRLDIPVLKRADFLGKLLDEKTCLAVAGSHGKTTTTALLAWVLTELAQDPGYIVGGTVKNLNTNAHAGAGEYFVIEADEYDYMFLGLAPHIAVITNVEHDHPDMFPTADSFFDAFRQFITGVDPGGAVLYCADDAGAKTLSEACDRPDIDMIGYGLDTNADYRVERIRETADGQGYTAIYPSGKIQEVRLQLAGEHSVPNSLAVMAVIDRLGLPAEAAAGAVARFEGSERRFEVLGQAAGVTIIDDYAHHPTEIRATLSAARQRYPEARVWVVWQPHTFSRTLTLQAGYQTAFVDADEIVVTDVFAARETRPLGFEMGEIVRQIEHDSIRYMPGHTTAVDLLVEKLETGDVLLVLSAGDATRISREVLVRLQNMSEVVEQ